MRERNGTNTTADRFEVGLGRTAANHQPLTRLGLIARTAAIHPNRPFVVHGGRRYTWAETYDARCRRLAATLRRRGIGRGNTVAVMAINAPEMYEAHFDVPMSGAVRNTLNIRLDADTIAYCLRHEGGDVMSFGSQTIRLSKIIITGGLAFWAFLVMLGNILDYDSNLPFVQHVLTMDTVFADSTLRARAIADPALHTAAFVVIIVTEGLVSLAFLIATVAMIIAFKANTETFRRARAWTAIGVALGFALWFIAFFGIAGEWFVMWQSSSWNAQWTSFQIVLTVVASGMYVLMDNDGA